MPGKKKTGGVSRANKSINLKLLKKKNSKISEKSVKILAVGKSNGFECVCLQIPSYWWILC